MRSMTQAWKKTRLNRFSATICEVTRVLLCRAGMI